MTLSPHLTRLVDPTDPVARAVIDEIHARLGELAPPLPSWALRLGIHRTITAASLGVVPDELLGEARAAIDALVAEGLLTSDESREATWRFAPVVHRAVAQRQHERNPRAARRIHDELVAVLAAADDAQLDEDLLHHARWAARWDVLAQLWWRAGQALLLRGSPVAAWAYRTLPPGVAERYPTLALAELTAEPAAGGVRTADPRMLRAIASGSAASLPQLWRATGVEAVLATGTMHVMALCHTGDLTGANAWIDAVENELHRRGDQVGGGARRQFQIEAAAARLLVGRILDVRHYAGAVIAEATGSPAEADPAVQRAHGQLALVSSMLGWEPDGPALDERPAAAAPLSIRIALAHRAADDLDRDELRRLVEDMEARQSPLWAFVLVARSLLALLDGRPLDELPRLELVESDHRNWLRDEDFAARLVRRCRSELLLASGELQRASAILLTREPLAPELRVPLARLYLHTEQPRTALDFVTQVLTDPSLSPRERGTFETIRAAAQLILGHHAGARRTTRTMFDRYPGTPPGWSLQTMLLPRDLRMRMLSLTPEDAVPAVLAQRLTRIGGPAPAPSPRLISLSPRERVVVAELRRGGTLAEIGARLCVSSNTLKKQTVSIYRKLEVDGRDAAIRRADRLGLLD